MISFLMVRTGPSWGSAVSVADVVAGSPTHPADTYLFDGLGWKDRADVDDEKGEDFLTVCMEDPGRNY